MCVGAVVCAVKEIEKSTLFWGEGGKCDQDNQKSNFTTKCLNTLVAHCSFCQSKVVEGKWNWNFLTFSLGSEDWESQNKLGMRLEFGQNIGCEVGLIFKTVSNYLALS